MVKSWYSIILGAEDNVDIALRLGFLFRTAIGEGGVLVSLANSQSDKTHSEQAILVTSPFIDVVGGHRITFSPGDMGLYGKYYFQQYDSSENPIGGYYNYQSSFATGRTITLESGAKYVRLCCNLEFIKKAYVYDNTDQVYLFKV